MTTPNPARLVILLDHGVVTAVATDGDVRLEFVAVDRDTAGAGDEDLLDVQGSPARLWTRDVSYRDDATVRAVFEAADDLGPMS